MVGHGGRNGGVDVVLGELDVSLSLGLGEVGRVREDAQEGLSVLAPSVPGSPQSSVTQKHSQTSTCI